MFIRQSLGALALSWAIAASANAQVVLYDNFGPGDSYQNSSGWGFGSSDLNFEQAMAFTLSDTFLLTAGEFGISLSIGQNPSAFAITVHADDGDGLPGEALEEVAVQTNLGSFGLPNGPVTVNFAGTTVLSAGEQYWISMSASGFNSYVWNANSTGDLGQRAFRLSGGQWNAANGNEAIGAFRLHGTLVPAPGAIGLLGVGVFARRGRRRASTAACGNPRQT